MAYQAPTSLATGRDSMGSVAYTMSDARYTRGDNNASPVPSTLSQQVRLLNTLKIIELLLNPNIL